MGFDKLTAVLGGRPVLGHSLSAFQDCDAVGEIVVVTSPDRFDFVRDLARREAIAKLTEVVAGGAERHLSVWNGIRSCPAGAKMIAVHDGARPLVTADAIRRCIDTAGQTEAAALAHPVTDTLKRTTPDSNTVSESVSRDHLWAMETPQVFSAALLRKAYERLLEEEALVTDEVSAIERLGHPVTVCHGPAQDELCPLLEEHGSCGLVDAAHGVVFEFDLSGEVAPSNYELIYRPQPLPNPDRLIVDARTADGDEIFGFDGVLERRSVLSADGVNAWR